MAVTLNLPESVFSAIKKDPQEFASAMRLAAAVKWYEMGTISQEKAAEVAGLGRVEFVDALKDFKVTPFQYGAMEVREELKDGY